MRILVVGSGGREHALVWKLSQSSKVDKIYCAPGNGGIAKIATCLPIKETEIDQLVHFAKENSIDLTVVGPESSLIAGIVDRFREEDLAIFGPNQQAARIEGSKHFAKDLMKKYRIPTADYQVFTDGQAAKEYVYQKGAPIVVKADGLASGKGVVVAHSIEEAIQAIEDAMENGVFGAAGRKLVIEEYLEGDELSLMAFVDGTTVRPMVLVQDHKPLYNGGKGPNTGGMGTYSPVPPYGKGVRELAMNEIIHLLVEGLAKEGIHYRGVLYAGLMMVQDRPYVIEFNARFGDPETQVVLPRLKTDLLDILLATANGELEQYQLEWDHRAAVCTILASGGYPSKYQVGYPITGLENVSDCFVFHAGTKEKAGRITTAGGRVLGVTALGEDLQQARQKVYNVIQQIHFENMYYRTDIAKSAASKQLTKDLGFLHQLAEA